MAKQAIYKYPLAMDDLSAPQELRVPGGGRIVHVGQQDQVPTVWILCWPESATIMRRLRVVGTGWPTPGGNYEYRGTALCGAFVWHVFEEVPF